jgi:hypothetical protein
MGFRLVRRCLAVCHRTLLQGHFHQRKGHLGRLRLYYQSVASLHYNRANQFPVLMASEAASDVETPDELDMKAEVSHQVW